jgi:hypothetical protein
MTKTARTAIVAALAVPLGLVGCSTGVSDDNAKAIIESSVVSVDHVTGAYIGFTSSGAQGKGVLVNLYLDSGDVADLTAAADGTLRAVWTSSPFKPAFVHFSLSTIPKPDNAMRLEGNAINPAEVLSALDIDGSTSVRQLIMVEASSLTARYGEWQEPTE